MDVVDEKGNKIPQQESKRIIAGVFGIILGELGIHKFILGYTKEGLLQIGVSIITCGIAGLIGKIEGIIYLTKSDDEFIQEYQTNKKPWF
ncbi:MAG: TM2 domain-containing protein [Flavobacteriaceae bacterium]